MKFLDVIQETGDATGTLAGDIAHVSYPLFVKGKTQKERTKNAKKATGQCPVGEAHVLDHSSVIHRIDKENPMNDTEVLVLGGAGRYTLKSLRDKARREANELFKSMEAEHGYAFRGAAYNIKQLTNTLNTIVAAYNELKRIRAKGGRGSRGITDEDANLIKECISLIEKCSDKNRKNNMKTPKGTSIKETLSTTESTGLRLIAKIEDGNRLAKVYKDLEWQEFRVKFYVDGVHQKEADHHTDDKEDATDTASHWVSQVTESDHEEYQDEYDWEGTEEQELENGDYVRDEQEGKGSEVFKMRGDVEDRKVRIEDKDGRGWYISPSRLIRVNDDDPAIVRYFGSSEVDEATAHGDLTHGSPYDRGSADAWYHRPKKPHKNGVGGTPVLDLTPDEIDDYNAGYDQTEEEEGAHGGKQYESVAARFDKRRYHIVFPKPGSRQFEPQEFKFPEVAKEYARTHNGELKELNWDEYMNLINPGKNLSESPDAGLQAILDKHSVAFAAFNSGKDISDYDEFYTDLFDYYLNAGEMPYGVAKARTGDPVNWIADKLSALSEMQPVAERKDDDSDKASDADKKSADKNIVMQIRKASDYENPTTIELDDGSKFKITANIANKILASFDRLIKTDDRKQLQDMLNTRDGFKQIVSYVKEDKLVEAAIKANKLIKVVFGNANR